MPALDAERLGAALANVFGAGVRVEGLRRLSGGASRETYAFDAVTAASDVVPLVLRRDPGAGTVGNGMDRGGEAALLTAAASAGVPVPDVRLVLGASDGLGDGFVMDRIDGETIARKILRDDDFAAARPRMAAQCGEIAARVHAIDLDAVPNLVRPVDDDPTHTQLEQYRQYLDAFAEPHPTFELGLRWLSERVPEPARLTVVHGDFRNGNFIVGPDGIRSVLDWELAHIGDPIEDLGWLCVKAWRFGVVDHPVGGFGSYDDLVGAYEAATGAPVDRDALRFWEAFGTLKWGVMCIIQAFTHLNGLVRSVELATIGRRVCENEHDLLSLLT